MRQFGYATSIAIVSLFATLHSSAYGQWELTITGDSEPLLTQQNITRSGAYKGYAKAYRTCPVGTGIPATSFFGDSHAEVKVNEISRSIVHSNPASASTNGTCKWTWRAVGGIDPTLYNWTLDAMATASAKVDFELVGIGNDLLGSVTMHAFARLTADTATCESTINEKTLWVGARVLEAEGGVTGVGIGATSGSISWSVPNPQLYDPSISQTEPVNVSLTDDDPGSTCFLELHTGASGSADAFSGTVSYNNRLHNLALGFLNNASQYPATQIAAPQLKN